MKKDKKQKEHQAFMRFLNRTAKEVSKWPDWVKRSANHLFEYENNNEKQ